MSRKPFVRAGLVLSLALLVHAPSAFAQSPAAQRGLTFVRTHCAQCHSIDKVSESGAKGGVREIARAIEDQIADGLVDAKTAGAKQVRLAAKGEAVEVIPVYDDEQGASGTSVERGARDTTI